jgi:hypothetical protein
MAPRDLTEHDRQLERHRTIVEWNERNGGGALRPRSRRHEGQRDEDAPREKRRYERL